MYNDTLIVSARAVAKQTTATLHLKAKKMYFTMSEFLHEHTLLCQFEPVCQLPLFHIRDLCVRGFCSWLSHWFEVGGAQSEQEITYSFATIRFEQHLNQNLMTYGRSNHTRTILTKQVSLTKCIVKVGSRTSGRVKTLLVTVLGQVFVCRLLSRRQNDQVIKKTWLQETPQQQLQRQPSAMINLQPTLLHYLSLLY